MIDLDKAEYSNNNSYLAYDEVAALIAELRQYRKALELAARAYDELSGIAAEAQGLNPIPEGANYWLVRAKKELQG